MFKVAMKWLYGLLAIGSTATVVQQTVVPDTWTRNNVIDKVMVLSVGHSSLFDDGSGPLGARYPVIVIHGRIPGVRGSGMDKSALSQINDQLVRSLTVAASAKGQKLSDLVKLYYFTYDTSQSAQTIADELYRLIEANAELTTGRKRILVAHSFGCLISRWYCQKTNKVAKALLVAGPCLGTPASVVDWMKSTFIRIHPHVGATVADRLVAVMELGNPSSLSMYPSEGGYLPVRWQGSRNNDLARLDMSDDYTRYMCYAGRIADYRGQSGAVLDLIEAGVNLMRRSGSDRAFYRVSGFVLGSMSDDLPLENDGMVPVFSALMESYTAIDQRRYYENIDHSGMWRSDLVARDIWQDLGIAIVESEASNVKDLTPVLDFNVRLPGRIDIWRPSLSGIDAVWVSNGDLYGIDSQNEPKMILPGPVAWPRWTPDGKALLVTIQDRGRSVIAKLSDNGVEPMLIGDLPVWTDDGWLLFRYNGSLFCIDPITKGGIVVLKSGVKSISQPPVVIGKRVYLVANKNLYEVPLASNKKSTKPKLTGNIVAIARSDKWLLALSQSGKTYELNAVTPWKIGSPSFSVKVSDADVWEGTHSLTTALPQITEMGVSMSQKMLLVSDGNQVIKFTMAPTQDWIDAGGELVESIQGGEFVLPDLPSGDSFELGPGHQLAIRP